MLLPACLSAEVMEDRLDNGMKVLIIEDHKAPVATFQVWYKVGSRDEPAGKRGISHLLEHMMFKGTPKYGSKVFSQMIKNNGGVDNAFTTRDHTAYFQILSSDRLDISIELEADRMRNLLLDPKELEAEARVVMEERRLRTEDDPQNLLFEEVIAAAFKAHPYKYPVIGWMSDLSSIDRDDMADYYNKYYSPDNAFIIVVGDVDAGEVLKEIRAAFGPIPKGAARPEVATEEPEQSGEKRVYLEKEASLPYILIAYHVPNFPDEDSYALDVLSSILSGKSGRLYRNIINGDKVAVNAFGEYLSDYLDPMLFILGGTALPGKDIEEVETALIEEIEKIKRIPPLEREVQKARNQVEAAFIMGQDSLYSQARVIGSFEMLGGWRLKDRYVDGIRNVKPEDVQRVARKYFVKNNRTVGILMPRSNSKGKNMR
ncbi:MAG: insulinase family protein [Nitrospirota bacterium]|nr:MAG: insulinase family protein [Nitrospirota bacterium]